MQHLEIKQVGYDQNFYPRANGKEDWLTVFRYKEAIVAHPWKADVRKRMAFPPIVVVRSTGYDWPYLLLDGLHRLRAFHNAGHEKIWAEVERLPQSKWLARSVELNIDSKRALDAGDKRWVAMRLKEDGWEDGQVATLLEMEPSSFQKLVSTGCQRLTAKQAEMVPEGRGNRKINGDRYGFLKAPFADATGTANAIPVLQSQGKVSSREPMQIVDSFLALLESGCVDMTNEELVEKLKSARSMLKRLMGKVAA